MQNFTHKLTSRIFRKTLNPELEKAGGLPNALNLELAKINAALSVSVANELTKMPVHYARVENGNKFSQVYVAAAEKLYVADFWKDGVCLAHAKTNDIAELAKVLNFWLCEHVSTSVLAEKYTFVQPADKAKAFEENTEVDYNWKFLFLDDQLGLSEFVKLACKDEILNTLFPFTSLYTLCFSRCTGYPYDTTDIPSVTAKQYAHFALPNFRDHTESETPSDETIFVVIKNRKEYLGEGNALEALKLVRDNLPDNIGPAIKGTAVA